MSESQGKTGLIIEEPLLWEKGKKEGAGSPFPGGTLPQRPWIPPSQDRARTFPISVRWMWFGIIRGSPHGISGWIPVFTLWAHAP